MTPKNQTKRGDRRARQNKSPNRTTTIVDIRQSFERRLASRSDTIACVGKTLLQLPSTSSNGVTSNSLSPSVFGVHFSSIAQNFTKWRILSLQLIWPIPSSTATAYGVFDDDGVATDLPSTNIGVYELRVSSLALTNQSAYTEWKPIDKSKWYYTSGQSSANDIRDYCPCSLVAYNNGAGTAFNVECYYTIELSGGL